MNDICPKCSKGKITQNVSLTGIIFKRKKIVTYYCQFCEFENIKEFNINEDTYRMEIKRIMNLNNLKEEESKYVK